MNLFSNFNISFHKNGSEKLILVHGKLLKRIRFKDNKNKIQYCQRFWSRYVTVTLPHRYFTVTSPLPHRYLTVTKINVRFRINNWVNFYNTISHYFNTKKNQFHTNATIAQK